MAPMPLKSRIWKAVEEFGDITTIHGLHTAIKGQGICAIFWFLMFLFSFTGCAYMFSQSILKYLSHPVSTSVTDTAFRSSTSNSVSMIQAKRRKKCEMADQAMETVEEEPKKFEDYVQPAVSIPLVNNTTINYAVSIPCANNTTINQAVTTIVHQGYNDRQEAQQPVVNHLPVVPPPLHVSNANDYHIDNKNSWHHRVKRAACLTGDCWNDNGAGGSPDCTASGVYTGNISVSITGRPCQAWSQQTPQSHGWASLSSESNYCRNPDGEVSPWCYTINPYTRWEFCFLMCGENRVWTSAGVGSGKYYHVLHNQMNCNTARNSCKYFTNGTAIGDLAVITSASDNNLVRSLTTIRYNQMRTKNYQLFTKFWLGMVFTGPPPAPASRTWVDGTPVTLASWLPSEPNSAAGEQVCAVMDNPITSGNWDDYLAGNSSLRGVCQLKVVCNWSAWSPWSTCTSPYSKKYGTQTRNRTKGVIEQDPGTCEGADTDIQSCEGPGPGISPQPVTCVKVYEYYSSSDTAHKYTLSSSGPGGTFTSTAKNTPFAFIALQQPAGPYQTALPVYELFSASLKWYFYTTNITTRLAKLDTKDWVVTGIPFYVLPTSSTEGTTLLNLIESGVATASDSSLNNVTTDTWSGSLVAESTLGKVWRTDSSTPCYVYQSCINGTDGSVARSNFQGYLYGPVVGDFYTSICTGLYNMTGDWLTNFNYCQGKGGQMVYFALDYQYFLLGRVLQSSAFNQTIWTGFKHTTSSLTSYSYYYNSSVTPLFTDISTHWMKNTMNATSPSDPYFHSQMSGGNFAMTLRNSDRQFGDVNANDTDVYFVCMYINAPILPNDMSGSVYPYDCGSMDPMDNVYSSTYNCPAPSNQSHTGCNIVYSERIFDGVVGMGGTAGFPNFTDAQNYCVKRKAFLTQLYTIPDFSKLKTAVQKLGYNVWVGLYHHLGYTDMAHHFWFGTDAVGTTKLCQGNISATTRNFLVNGTHFAYLDPWKQYYYMDHVTGKLTPSGPYAAPSAQPIYFACTYDSNHCFADICTVDGYRPFPGNCSDPLIPNTIITSYPNQTGTFTPGAQGNLTCSPDYPVIEGPATAVCDNAIWSPNFGIVECKKICDNITNNGSVVDYAYTDSYTGQFVTDRRAGSNATLACDAGYGAWPHNVSYCQTDGTWLPSQFTCMKTCPFIPPAQGSVSYTTTTLDAQPMVGSNATFACNTGLILSHVNQLNCGEAGWDKSPPLCVPYCSDAVLAGATANYTHTEYTNIGITNKRPEGTIALFLCTGSAIVRGSTFATCNGTTWVNALPNEPPSCEAVPQEIYEQVMQLVGDIAQYEANPQALQELMQDYMAYFASSQDPDTLKAMGQQLAELVPDCRYQGKQCQSSDFESYLDSGYGNCYQFNNDGTMYSMAGYAGPEHGITLILYVNQSDYVATTERAGLAVVLARQQETIVAESMAYYVPLGYETHITASFVTSTKLPWPYSDCVDKPTDDITFYYKTKYTTEGCYRSCYQKLLVETCGCGDPRMPLPDGQKYCTALKRPCVQTFATENTAEILNTKCTCPNACEVTTYNAAITQSEWPTPLAPPTKCRSAFTNMTLTDCIDNYRSNYAKLRVFMKNLDYESIVEQPGYDLLDLASDFGGLTGTFLGVSVISFFEFLALLTQMIRYGVRKNMDDVDCEEDEPEEHQFTNMCF